MLVFLVTGRKVPARLIVVKAIAATARPILSSLVG